LSWWGKGILFPPPIIQVGIFENIETTSETKTIKELNYYQIYIKMKTIIYTQ